MLLIHKYVLLQKLIWLTKQADILNELKWKRGAFREWLLSQLYNIQHAIIIDRWTLDMKNIEECETFPTSQY